MSVKYFGEFSLVSNKLYDVGQKLVKGLAKIVCNVPSTFDRHFQKKIKDNFFHSK